jgi:predicted dehydrogenase
MKIAVVGLGMALTPHAKALLDLAGRVEVAHVWSPNPERRTTVAGRFGFPAAASLEQILADRSVDVLMILTPPNSHLELVERAVAAGKHVLLEKPIEITPARAEATVAAAKAAGRQLGVVLQNRFRPASLALSGLLADGRLGAIVSASARIWNWRPQEYYDQPGRGTLARDGGGVLLTQGIHTLDLLVAFAGLPVEVMAYAATSPVHRMETEDIAAAAIRFENGAMGTIAATTAAYPGFPEHIEMIGTRGTAVLDGTTLVVRLVDGTGFEVGDPAAGGGNGADPMAFPHHNHLAVLTDFVEAVETGRPPRISGEEALKVHRLIEALLESAEGGRAVSVRR